MRRPGPLKSQVTPGACTAHGICQNRETRPHDHTSDTDKHINPKVSKNRWQLRRGIRWTWSYSRVQINAVYLNSRVNAVLCIDPTPLAMSRRTHPTSPRLVHDELKMHSLCPRRASPARVARGRGLPCERAPRRAAVPAGSLSPAPQSQSPSPSQAPWRRFAPSPTS